MKKKKTKKCNKCNKEITVNNFERHYKVCQASKESIDVDKYKIESGRYQCPHCDEVFKKLGIKNHIWRQHTKEGEKYKKDFKSQNRVIWNKGLTKETSEAVKQYGETFKEKIKLGEIIPHQKGKHHSLESRKKMSNTVEKKVKQGTWHYSFSKTRTHKYKGVKLHGKWELQYAMWLDENNIKWLRPKENFNYRYENKERFYIPDFYLIDSAEYVEIKGYETEKDRCKWRDFPYKLKVIKGKELKEMGIITKKQFQGKE
jgi:hypothetical protein